MSFLKTRQNLTLGFLCVYANSYIIIIFAIFLRYFWKFSKLSGDPLRSRPSNMFRPRTEILGAPLNRDKEFFNEISRTKNIFGVYGLTITKKKIREKFNHRKMTPQEWTIGPQKC